MYVRSLLAALLLNALGQFCMMPVAHAAMPMDMHEGSHLEMVMTPAQPMSPLHCTSCIPVVDGPMVKSAPVASVPCAGGHCMSQGPSVATGLSASSGLQWIAGGMPTVTSTFVDVSREVAFTDATAPPSSFSTETVVLRL